MKCRGACLELWDGREKESQMLERRRGRTAVSRCSGKKKLWGLCPASAAGPRRSVSRDIIDVCLGSRRGQSRVGPKLRAPWAQPFENSARPVSQGSARAPTRGVRQTTNRDRHSAGARSDLHPDPTTRPASCKRMLTSSSCLAQSALPAGRGILQARLQGMAQPLSTPGALGNKKGGCSFHAPGASIPH